MNDFEHLYTIQQLSVKLNIPKPTLRFWEKELNRIIIPFRTQGGQRRYTAENLKVIEEINKLRKAGISIPGIRRALDNRSEPLNRTSNANNIEDLPEKIAEVVKNEIYKFLKIEMNKI